MKTPKFTIVNSKRPSLLGGEKIQKNIYDENKLHFVAIINDSIPEHLQDYYIKLFTNAPKLLEALNTLANVDMIDDASVFKAQQLAHRTLSLFNEEDYEN
jgi:hypothetical protein